ncbi:MAG: hypothetical protein KKC54_05815 [Nanoarchaeota archaeon]|nr:hypothetical protein [Nanoarchaeota archaeon]
MNNILKSKTANLISFNVINHILEIIFIISVGVFVFFIIHFEKNIDTFPIESEILADRILYSNNGLWFYDENISRLYPGTIELNNFNNKEKIELSLAKTMDYGDENKRAAAELILEDSTGSKFGPIYYNEQKYREWIEWYRAGVTKGAGARQGEVRKTGVVIKKDNELSAGILTMTILIPND